MRPEPSSVTAETRTGFHRCPYWVRTRESVNARIRKAVRARGHFPNEAAALTCIYMALTSLDPTGKRRKRWTMR
ncbi:transposase [Streptomyces avermitilis]|uniref:transposase n=1 Tax=Streptomyces avermitilis TaxID=33903 RepID=UPI003F4C92D1